MILAPMTEAATTTQKAPAAKSTKAPSVRRPSTTAHTAPGVRRPASHGSTQAASGRTAARKGVPVKAVTWRTRQLSPSTDRYKEIQEALATRGYLSPDQASGAWNDASAEALKRFQMEQNLEPSGKLNSLSLIALGLGPKHDSAAMQIAAPAPENR